MIQLVIVSKPQLEDRADDSCVKLITEVKCDAIDDLGMCLVLLTERFQERAANGVQRVVSSLDSFTSIIRVK